MRVLRLSILLLGACQAPAGARGPDLGLTPSILPNLGLALTGSVPLARSARRETRLELRLTDQFLDDKNVASNGDPRAGNWTQVDLGLRWNELGPRTFWTQRAGLVAFEARGEPNLVEVAGGYLGLYYGFGRLTHLTEHLVFGPELTLIASSGNDPRVLIPQLTWGFTWTP